jgi:hypothetical protein
MRRVALECHASHGGASVPDTSTSTQLVVVFLVAVVPLSILAGSIYWIASPEQRIEFQSRLLVQLLGTVFFGDIVTYSLYTIEHSRENQEKRNLELAAAATNKKRVLGYIKEELSYDLKALESRDGAFNAQASRLKSEFWKISGLSGDLRWIDDPGLLSSISQAYFDVDIAADWERRQIDAMTGPGLTISMNFADGTHKSILEFIDPFMRNSYKSAKASIGAALQKLKDN